MDRQRTPPGDISNVCPQSRRDPGMVHNSGTLRGGSNQSKGKVMSYGRDENVCMDKIKSIVHNIQPPAGSTHVQEGPTLIDITNINEQLPYVATTPSKRTRESACTPTTQSTILTHAQRTRFLERQRYSQMNSQKKEDFLQKKRESLQRSTSNGTCLPQVVSDWLNSSYNNMLAASEPKEDAPHRNVVPTVQQSSEDVKEWYNLCYNNLLSQSDGAIVQDPKDPLCSPIIQHHIHNPLMLSCEDPGQVIHGDELVIPATVAVTTCSSLTPGVFEMGTQTHVGTCTPAIPNRAMPANISSPFGFSSVSSEVKEKIAANQKHKRERDWYANMEPDQKESLLRRMREYKQSQRQQSVTPP